MHTLKTTTWLVNLLSIAIFLVSWAGQGQETTKGEPAARTAGLAEELPAATGTVETTVAPTELSERTELLGFGFSIAHPTGWQVKREGPTLAISERAEDLESSLEDNITITAGYVISFDHRDMSFLGSIGLPEEATLQDLYEMNVSFFDWPDSLEVLETEVFGVPSLAIKTPDEAGNWTQVLMGYVGEEAFLLMLAAPDEDALEAFMPTWQRVLDSIEPSAGS